MWNYRRCALVGWPSCSSTSPSLTASRKCQCPTRKMVRSHFIDKGFISHKFDTKDMRSMNLKLLPNLMQSPLFSCELIVSVDELGEGLLELRLSECGKVACGRRRGGTAHQGGWWLLNSPILEDNKYCTKFYKGKMKEIIQQNLMRMAEFYREISARA